MSVIPKKRVKASEPPADPKATGGPAPRASANGKAKAKAETKPKVKLPRVKLDPPLVIQVTQEQIDEMAAADQPQAQMLNRLYESLVKARTGNTNRRKAHARRHATLHPDALLWVGECHEVLDKLISKTDGLMEKYARATLWGRWALSIGGVAARTVTGMLAEFDLHEAPTFGHFYQFAGLVPPERKVFRKGLKRNYNARLGSLCYLVGENFKRFTGSPAFKADPRKDVHLYARLYLERKAKEEADDKAGLHERVAHERLERLERRRVDIGDEQRKKLESGHLQPCGLDRRAAVYAVKMFVSHLWEVGRRIHNLPVCLPYSLAHQDHAHYIPPPNWPMREEG